MKSYGSVYDHLGKGHDRLYLDDANGIFAVFDGAGGESLSEACASQLPAIIARETAVSDVESSAFAKIITSLDSLPEGYRVKSTVAMACVKETLEGVAFNYFNAGDSSLYFFNKTKGDFKLLAHTPTEFVVKNGRKYISTAEFLGAERSLTTIAKQIGGLLLPHSAEWTIVGITDGVKDDDGQGIATVDLKQIIRYSDPRDIPDQILSNIDKYDDASVFVTSNID
ncbi:MAG: hypothetical protein ABIV43_02355 [Candidatus Saccharimonadales bacterium]